MKITSFDPGGLDVVSLGLFSTGYVSTSSNSYSSAVASNTLAIGGVVVTGAAASNFHMLASSPTAAAWVPDAPVAAPTTADYLVGTAQTGLSAEIVVGAAPGGELSGTWASPTVDATHSGSAHLALGATSSTAAPGNHDHWQGAWSDATAYAPGDMVTLDGASWVCLVANEALRPFPPDYREAALSTVPLGYWRLGEASGTVAVDEMGVHNGTYVNSPTLGVPGLLAGDPNTAVDFDPASSHYMSTGTLPAITQRTLACWIKPDTAADGVMVGIGSTAAYLRRTATDGLYMNFRDSTVTARSIASAAGLLTAADLHFVAGSHDGTTARLYIDGTEVAANATWNVGATISVGWNVGRYAAASLHFPGVIDEPAIWDRAVTPAEIAGLNAVGTGTVVWERLTPPAAYVDPATATAGTLATALIAAGLMAAS